MDEASVHTLSQLGELRQYAKGDYICHQGTPGDEIFLIVDGIVEIRVQAMNDDNVLINTCEVGDFFWETALMELEPRMASCIAAQTTICVAINRLRIREMLHFCPDLAERLIIGMSIRLRDLNAQIYRTEIQKTEIHIKPLILPKAFREHPITQSFYAPDRYLIKTDNICPVCGKPVKISHLRMNEVMCIRVLNSQRHIYNGLEILWHHIWKCHRCGYANFHANFFKKPEVNQAMIMRLVSMQNKTLSQIVINYPIDEVIFNYYRAIHFNECLNASNVILTAKLWRYLCWIYTDADDLEMANFCRDKALFHYRYIHQKGQDILTTEDIRQQCAMIVAELYLEKGQFDKAKPYYDEVVKYCGRVLAQKAYDRLFEIMDS